MKINEPSAFPRYKVRNGYSGNNLPAFNNPPPPPFIDDHGDGDDDESKRKRKSKSNNALNLLFVAFIYLVIIAAFIAVFIRLLFIY